MPKLSIEQLRNIHERGISGAYSPVTLREATGDHSVTVDQHEKKVLHELYNASVISQRVNGRDTLETHKDFLLLDTTSGGTSKISLALKYPKSDGHELRLYFSGSQFHPPAHDYWFILHIEGKLEPLIGYMDKASFADAVLNTPNLIEHNSFIDEEDEIYQIEINKPKPIAAPTTRSVTTQARSITTAKQALKLGEYKCAYNEEHETFISSTSGKQYCEAHHLIPIGKSNDFENSLDVLANIVTLCPNCHRAVHGALAQHKRRMLELFYDQRQEALHQSGINISINTLLNYYNAQ